MSSPIVTRQLTKHFRHTEAVRELDLDVPAGSIFGLIGPNGAGKTTTIQLLMNLLRPTSGAAEVLGVDARRLGPRELARIGYVSENQEMPGEMTVGYFLRYWEAFYPNWDRDLATEMARQFDLPLDRRLRHLSRGMRMKAALASSLAYRPELILLDEPFSGLDALVRQELVEGLLDRAENTTILISSHDLAEIESFASHIGYIEAGTLRFTEEAGALAARFRRVEIVFDETPELPRDWPAAWLEPQRSAAVLRFTDSAFDAEATPAEIRRLFPAARRFDFTPLPLKEIFIALAATGRRAAAA
jgi:ABC-2 type transport system ATP-binding protein